MTTPLIIGLALAGAAALVHVYIFVLESLRWTEPGTRRIFGVRSEEDARTTGPLAFNQGFYNLFLAVIAAIGVVLVVLGDRTVGSALIYAGAGSMVLAAVVLLASNGRMLRAAAVQGALPLLAIVLVAASLGVVATPASRGLPASFEPVDVLDVSRGLPDGVEADPGDTSLRAYLSDDGELQLVTYGSGSCPTVPVFYDSADASALTLTLESTGGPACSADLAASTVTIRIPPGFDGVDVVRIESDRLTVERIDRARP